MTRSGAILTVALLMTVAAGSSRAAVVSGRVVDLDTGKPVPWVDLGLVVEGAETATLSDPEGLFRFRRVPAGAAMLQASRIGYRTERRELVVPAGSDTLRVRLVLETEAVTLESVDVSGSAIERADDLYVDQAPVSVTGQELREQMGGTIAAVLADHTGISEETMGPAPARPVVRGLSGNRVMILEDEIGTGDLSATAPDHALVVDPLNASRIEVIRGPATLLYGSSVLGGVINVRRGAVPLVRPESTEASVAYIGDTVNAGSAGRLTVSGPAGDFGYTVDAIARTGDDVSTPLGDMRNSQIDGWNGSAGLSWFGNDSHVGVAHGRYNSDYGIPGGFRGGHPNGVDIELERQRTLMHAGIHFDDGVVESAEFFGGYSRYFHEELESSGRCGVSYGLLQHEWTQRTHLRPGAWGHSVFALSYRNRDFAQGCLSFVPQTVERTYAAAAYNEKEWSGLRWVAAARGSYREVDPSREEVNKAGAIRTRSFSGVGAALAVARDHGRWATTTVTLTRAFRAPAIEELYSEGPHLAAYSYEVGNADLDSETGVGAELRFDWRARTWSGTLTGFVNDFDRFIHPRDTGELEFGPGSEGFLERWQYVGTAVRMAGAEARVVWRATPRFELTSEASFVRAEDRDFAEPLIRMPPAMGRFTARYRTGEWTFAANVRGAVEQNRVAEFEVPTAGYVTGGVSVEWNRLGQGTFQSILLRVNNVSDLEYRNHLSRIRSVLPEPGRNVTLMFRAGVF